MTFDKIPEFNKDHEDFRLLLYAKAMSQTYFTYQGVEYQYITVGDAIKFIGA